MDAGLNDCRREAYREVGRTVFGTAKGMQGREITNIDIKKRGVLMCTAATYKTKDFYFGRTLDYEFSYGEEIVIMPRNYPIPFRFEETDRKHYAIIGTAHVADGYPMFYDAVNEKGLGMAGLNFVGNAVYRQEILPTESGTEKAAQAAQYEFITWILRRCANVSQAREKLETLNLSQFRCGESGDGRARRGERLGKIHVGDGSRHRRAEPCGHAVDGQGYGCCQQ